MIELRILQQYLELTMWKTNTEVGADTCGRYPRCAYCIRTQEFACAKAFLSCMRAGRDGVVPKNGFPEPPAKEFFGDALIEARPPEAVTEGAQTVYTLNSLYGQVATSIIFSEAFAQVRAADAEASTRQITAGNTQIGAPELAEKSETKSARRVAGERVLNVKSGFTGDRTPIAKLTKKQLAE